MRQLLSFSHMRYKALLGLMLAMGITLVASSCLRESCEKVTCQHGTCMDGDCQCESGWEGWECEVPNNARFSGTYMSTAPNCSTGTRNAYPITVAPVDGTVDQAYITGLWESEDYTLVAQLGPDGTSFEIAPQEIYPLFTLLGTDGTITADGKTINMTYFIYFQDSTLLELDRCVVSFKRD